MSSPDPPEVATAHATGNIGPWSAAWEPEPELRAAFEGLISSLRRVQDLVAGARPSVEVAQRLGRQLEAVAGDLAPYQVSEAEQLAGKQHNVPGRSQALVPALTYDYADADRAGGRVVFGRFYLGGGGAVHGGALPLLFDELLGRLAGAGGRPRSRTAYLHVDYRAVTPLGVELRLDGAVDRIEGRKIFITGTLRHEKVLLCEAEGLFVTLRPGQP